MAAERPDTSRVLHALAAPLAVFASTVLVQLPFFRRWFAFMDEGHILQFADIVAQGGEFYRDATFYPLPGAFWLLALAFECFGTSMLVSRWLVMLEFAAFVAILFALLRRLTDARFAVLGVGALWLYRIWCFPHWQIYSYSTTSLLALLAAIALLLAYFRGRDLRVLAAAGFVYGLGVLCKQDYGAAALLALGPLFAAFARSVPPSERPGLGRLLVTFFAPAAAVGAATGLYFWRAGLLGDLLRFTVFNHFVGMDSFEYMQFPSLFPLFGQDPAMRTRISIMGYMPSIVFTADWVNVRAHPLFTSTPLYEAVMKLFFFGPIAYYAFAWLRLARIRPRAGQSVDPEARQRFFAELALVAFGSALVLLVWLNKPQDYLHLAVLYWPLVLLGGVHAHALRARRRVAFFAAVAVAALPAALFVAYSLKLVLAFRAEHSALVPGERAGVYVLPAEAQMLGEVVDYVKANSGPDDRVAALPYFPIVNFLAERMGPHRTAYIIWPFPEIPERDEQVIAAMEATHTDLVVYHFTQFYSFNPVWEHAPKLFDYLVEQFEIERVFSYDAWGYKLAGLRRRPEAAREGRRIVPPGAQGLALYVEEDGPPRPVPPDAREAYVQEMRWPFQPVIALRPSTHGRRTVLELPVEVPAEGARLRSAVGVHAHWWFKLPPSWVDFRAVVRSDAGREVVFEKRLNPTLVLEDRGWFPVEVSLDRWAGQRVTLELAGEAEHASGASLWTAGWEIPRLVPPETGADDPAEQHASAPRAGARRLALP